MELLYKKNVQHTNDVGSCKLAYQNATTDQHALINN